MRRANRNASFLMFSLLRVCFFGVFISTRCAMGQDVNVAGIQPSTSNSYTVSQCALSPKIDGKIDDTCWKSATEIPSFYRFGSNSAVVEQTQAWICADHRKLYLAFHCIDAHSELIRSFETQRDGDISKDDQVGVEIDSQESQRGFSSFIVNARGTQWESIDSGTADNITWAGDWHAATRRTEDGWTAEMAIPFSLLKYRPGMTSLNVLLFRYMARETNRTNWPSIPPSVTDSSIDARYMQTISGLVLPSYGARAVVLPYTLLSMGQNNALHYGVDVKYPLSTTLTGVATYKPDFQTVEQNVTNVNFSYTEKYIGDQRPFFEEGSKFLPAYDIYYSSRISKVDEGLKLVGKDGPFDIGILGTLANGSGGQQAVVVDINREFGSLSNLAVNFVQGNQPGQPLSTVGRIAGSYAWRHGPETWYTDMQMTGSWLARDPKGQRQFADFGLNPMAGHPGFHIYYNYIAPDFSSNIGYVPELNRQGGGVEVRQSNRFDSGSLQSYNVYFQQNTWQYATGGFFHQGQYASVDLGYRSGIGIHLGENLSKRRIDPTTLYSDHVMEVTLSWGTKTLLQSGSIEYDSGTRADQFYAFTAISQGLQVTRNLSGNIYLDELKLGEHVTKQAVVTGTYRLDPYRSIGGRLVSYQNSNNIYASYGQRMRSGTDIFIIIGDPNSVTTTSGITLKLIQPL